LTPNIKKLNNERCGDCPIRHSAICSRCDADELLILEHIKTYQTFEAGQPIVWAGDKSQFVASVVVGVATMSKTMEDGRRQMVGLLLPSDFIGRPGRKMSVFDVVAATDVVLCKFKQQPFETLLAESPAISRRLLEKSLDELDAAREWMLLLGRKTAHEKIASLLAIIARRNAGLMFNSTSRQTIFDLPLTREAMSDYLGLTLETVSRQMSALKRSGVIELHGKRRIVVPDFARLINESGDDNDGGMLS